MPEILVADLRIGRHVRVPLGGILTAEVVGRAQEGLLPDDRGRGARADGGHAHDGLARRRVHGGVPPLP